MQLETKHLGRIHLHRMGRDGLGEVLEKHGWERRPKVRSIDDRVSARFGIVQILALATVELHTGYPWQVMETHRKKRMKLTVDSWTVTKVTISVFFKHLIESPSSKNVTSMDKAVKNPGIVFQGITVFFRLQFDVHKICYDVDECWKSADFLVETGKVEPVTDVFVVDVTEIFVSLYSQKQVDPVVSEIRTGIGYILISHICVGT